MPTIIWIMLGFMVFGLICWRLRKASYTVNRMLIEEQGNASQDTNPINS